MRPANFLFSIFLFSKFYGIKKHLRLPFLVKLRSLKFPLDRSFTPFIVLGEKGTGHPQVKVKQSYPARWCSNKFLEIVLPRVGNTRWGDKVGETGREERNISDKQNLPAIG